MRSRGKSLASVAAAAATATVFASSPSFIFASTTPPPQTGRPMALPLLGGTANWHFGSWQAVTDAVRGGVSAAFLEPDPAGAKFSGTLDPSKLNAGFAGVNLDIASLPMPLHELDGLCLNVAASDGREYTVLLKVRGGDKGTSYQVRFIPAIADNVDLPFTSFQAYSRGRPAPGAEALDLQQVESLSLQIASNFTQQAGPFSLVLRSISGTKL
ncbi:unnamed protein product [Polarella glacialis]|uniref:NADH:ubiquinone oxidoreductase intermediate-associated protein 30 domain-containing protein n=1 Tax=Polarella glacialis TaxID=89957 RepID=A0A813HN46_POLGL|nr:unnamed protein product [Polarella glacialis]CAE8638848.1 unnamed protein product [Polarella glacialis]